MRIVYKAFFMNLEGFTVLVLGAGSVGVRKARYFADAGARVRVVGEIISPEARALEEEGTVEIIETRLEPETTVAVELIRGSDIIVVATSDASFNDWASEYALSLGKLVNNAVDSRKGNLIIPFTKEVLGGRIKLAATSLGRSGIAVRRFLEQVEQCLSGDTVLEVMYDSLAFLKEASKKCVGDPKRRIALYFYVSEHPVFEAALNVGLEESLRAVGLAVGEVLSDQETECVRDELTRLALNRMF